MSTNANSQLQLYSPPELLESTAKNAATTLSLTGVSFRGVGIAEREQLALINDRYDSFMEEVSAHPGLHGAVVLTTCNRTEIVTTMSAAMQRQTTADVLHIWQEVSGVKKEWLMRGHYHLEQPKAIEHIFRVASGMDSMVLGEPQILGQMKSAFRRATELGIADVLLQRLFQRAFGVAKRVRAETSISRYPVSVAYAAKVLCEHIFGNLSDISVLLLGAGETGKLTVRHLKQAGVSRIVIASRTLSHAESAASEFGAEVVPWELYHQALAQSDIVVSACTIDHGAAPIVCHETASVASVRRPSRPQLFVDLGVPRTIAESVGSLPDAFLYNVDDLESVIKTNTTERQKAATQAEQLIVEETKKFVSWVGARHVHEQIRDARQRISDFERQEMLKSLRRLRKAGFSDEQCEVLKDVLTDYSDGLLAKVLHQPFSRLWNGLGRDEQVVEAFAEHFLEKSHRDESRLQSPQSESNDSRMNTNQKSGRS